MHKQAIFSLLSAAFLLPACAGEGEIDFRQADPFVEGHSGLLNRDGDVLLFSFVEVEKDGDDDDDDDDDESDVIYDILDHTRVLDGDGNTILIQTFDGVLYDVDGVPQCFVDQNSIGEVLLTAEDSSTDVASEPLFTLLGNRLLEGDGSDMNTLYSFSDFEMLAGPVQNQDVLVVGSDNLSKSTPYRKLLIGVLVDGQCGAPGLNPDPIPQ